MIPTSLIVTASFAFLLNPNGNNEDKHLKKETELKALIIRSIDMNLSLPGEKSGKNPGGNKKVISKSGKTILELPVECFYETPLELEEWMITPKNWKNDEN